MRLLLDTHIFIWWTSQPTRLSPQVLALCSDRANELLLSVASIWEMQIKSQLGKLQLSMSLPDMITGQQANGLIVLPIGVEHVLALQHLPAPQNDPFDRLLVAKAQVEAATLVSVDPIFSRYPVNVIG